MWWLPCHTCVRGVSGCSWALLGPWELCMALQQDALLKYFFSGFCSFVSLSLGPDVTPNYSGILVSTPKAWSGESAVPSSAQSLPSTLAPTAFTLTVLLP